MGKTWPENVNQTELVTGTGKGENDRDIGMSNAGMQNEGPRNGKKYDGEEHDEGPLVAEVEKDEAGTTRGDELRNCRRCLGVEKSGEEGPKSAGNDGDVPGELAAHERLESKSEKGNSSKGQKG